MENNSSTPSNSSSTEKSIRSGEYDSSTLSNASAAEHATLFAAPASTPQNQPSASSFSADITSSSSSKFPIFIFLLAPLFLVLIGGVGFALFKFDALCEPLGLCDKEDSDSTENSDSTEDSDLREDSDSTEDQVERGRSDGQLPGSNRTEPLLPPSHQDPNRRDAPPVIPHTRSTQTQPDSLPDREEALW